jgi:hypothetical protein
LTMPYTDFSSGILRFTVLELKTPSPFVLGLRGISARDGRLSNNVPLPYRHIAVTNEN